MSLWSVCALECAENTNREDDMAEHETTQEDAEELDTELGKLCTCTCLTVSF